LRAIAREWAHIDDIAAAKLRVIAAKLPAIVGGLTPKNKRTLRQFDDPQGLRRLMALPAMLMKRAVLEPRGNRALADAQAAMAVAILLYCPIRIGNLVDLKVGETIRLAPNSRIRGTISLPAEVVKNNIDMEFGLPPAVNNIIRTYFEKVESRVLRSSTAFVFASLDGSRRQQTGLAMLVSRMIFRETGIKMTPHQFRHLAAKNYLDAYPGEYEVVRQFLGHKNMKTTVRFYSGTDVGRAMGHLAKIVEQSMQPLRKGRKA
jgi:integrase